MEKIRVIVCIMAAGLCAMLAGCGESGSKKWRLDNNDLTHVERAWLEEEIKIREKAQKTGDWSTIDWPNFLIMFPQDAKKCEKAGGFEKFTGWDWSRLIAQEPRFEKQCEKFGGWAKMSNSNWISLLSENESFMKKADELDIWKNFSAKDWQYALSTKKPYLKDKCDKLDGWKHFDLPAWMQMIKEDGKFLEYAQERKLFDCLSADQWISILISEEDPKFLEIAKHKGIFKNFNSENWYDILSKKPEFVPYFKEVASFDIFTDKDLYKLYITVSNLRNEIFKLGRIDVDDAAEMENIIAKFQSRFDGNRRSFYSRDRGISGAELAVVFEMFPDYAISKLNEGAIKSFDKSVFVDLFSRCDKSVFDGILEKYAYAIAWKKISLSQWFAIVASQESGYDLFKKNVDIKTVSGAAIKAAMSDNVKNFAYVFEKHDMGRELSKNQWVEIFAKVQNSNSGFEASKKLLEILTGRKINTYRDLELAAIEVGNMSEAEKLDALNRAANSNAAAGKEDKLLGLLKGKKQASDEAKKEEQKPFDIVEIAKKCGVFEQFNSSDWQKALSGEYKDEITKEYYRINKTLQYKPPEYESEYES